MSRTIIFFSFRFGSQIHRMFGRTGIQFVGCSYVDSIDILASRLSLSRNNEKTRKRSVWYTANMYVTQHSNRRSTIVRLIIFCTLFVVGMSRTNDLRRRKIYYLVVERIACDKAVEIRERNATIQDRARVRRRGRTMPVSKNFLCSLAKRKQPFDVFFFAGKQMNST